MHNEDLAARPISATTTTTTTAPPRSPSPALSSSSSSRRLMTHPIPADIMERLHRVQRHLDYARATALTAEALHHKVLTELEELRDQYAAYQPQEHGHPEYTPP